MRYTTLGKTGLQVSVIGLGGHEYRWLKDGNIKGGRHVTFNPVRVDVVKRALEAGVNYFDTTFYEEVQSLGHVLSVLGVDKSSVIINGMSIDVVDRTKNMTHEERVAYIDQELSTRLELLGRDYFDIFMLCGVEKGFRQDVFDDVIAIYRGHQAAGRIRFVGTSGHDHELFLDLVTQGDAAPQDVLMCPWNYAVANNCGGLFPKIPQLMTVLAERGVGFVGMKNLCWTMYGIPFTCILNQSPSGDDIPGLVKQSIGWMTANGHNHTCIQGVETVKELDELLSGVDAGFDDAQLSGYLTRCNRIDVLLANAAHHSAEVQGRVCDRAKRVLGVDHGEDLASYQAMVNELAEAPLMDDSKI